MRIRLLDLAILALGVVCGPLGCSDGTGARATTNATAEDDSVDGAFLGAGGKADAAGIREGTAEAAGILRVANELGRIELVRDVGLTDRAAENIQTHRSGPDGEPGTDDDAPYQSLSALDAVPYVGDVTVTKMLDYARAQGWVTPEPPPQAHQLPGFDETLLLADFSGHAAVVRVGDAFSRTPVSPATNPGLLTARSHQGRFYLLYAQGPLRVVDAATGTLEQEVELPVPNGADLAWPDDSTVYLSSKDGSVVRCSLDTFEVVHTVDLSSLVVADGSIEPHQMLLHGNRLFVQVARRTASWRSDRGAIAVVDTTTDTVERVVELTKEQEGTTYVGLEPSFPMVVDPVRGQLLAAAAGVRPSSTGMLFRLGASTFEIDDIKPAQSGFQGMFVFGPPYSTLFMLYHTSTPTTSSHLFVYGVTENGSLVPSSEPPLVDAFDGLDALAINQAGTLVAMANTCVTGVCVSGAGVSFVDAATRELLPKLMAETIGFEPTVVQFR